MSTSQPTPVRGRFAPSPSGRMHLGNLCCALLAWLSVRSQNGEMLLRIEDLDPDRCTREKAELLMDDLTWLGLTWDEGPGHERTHAPYYQSARRELYESALSELRAKNDVYPCFCTRAELHAVSAPHAGDGTFRYPGLCRNLTPAEAEEKSRTRRPSLRFRAPDKSVTFEDLYCGPQNINVQSTFGDFIVRRSDGVHAYQLAVTVDDALMGVTEVVRGRDLAPFHRLPNSALSRTRPHTAALRTHSAARQSRRPPFEQARARPRHRRSAHAFHARRTPRPHGKFTWFPRPPGKNHPNRAHPGLQNVV